LFFYIIATSLLIIQLLFYKYYLFIINIINLIFKTNIESVYICLPIGISFTTFTSIGYLTDIYKNIYYERRTTIDKLLYLSYFPKFIAGPIIKQKDFFNNFNYNYKIKLKDFSYGIQIVAIGFFRKKVLADNLSIYVNEVYNTPNSFSQLTCILAIIAYYLQIYFDFSGYSDIAIGLSNIFGVKLNQNFNLPYISSNPTEFWKRWHISLSSWLQEYLYIPLGGNRHGVCRTYINLFLVMVIGGMWHGATVNFIIWGSINGLGLIVHKLFIKHIKYHYTFFESTFWYILSLILNQIFVIFCWVVFRGNTINNTFQMIQCCLLPHNGISHYYIWTFISLVFLIFEIMISINKCSFSIRNINIVNIRIPILDLNSISGLTIFFVFVGIIFIFANFGDTAFIYGNF
jgi:alginate O-acetyltransferase complex protein AlgI